MTRRLGNKRHLVVYKHVVGCYLQNVMKFSLRILFIITFIVACWLGVLPHLRAYNAIQHLSNSDLRVDGNYFRLDVRISGDAASTLEGLGSSANSWLLDAVDDSDKFAAAHVLLTKINMTECNLSVSEWNHLQVDLLHDGTVDFHPEQIPKLVSFWNRRLNHNAN